MPKTGRSSAGPPGRGTRPSAACPSSGANRATSCGRRRCRARVVVAGRRRRPRLADDGDQRARRARCARWRSTSRPAARSSTSRSFASGARDPLNAKNSLASPTPIVDGDRVYVHFGADGTAALTTSGEIVWKTRLPYESQHGNGGSPVLYRRPADRSAATAATRRSSWRSTSRPARSAGRRRAGSRADQAYSTPLVIRVGDRDQLVSVGAYRAAAYDPAPGKEIWRVELRRRLLERAAAGLRPRPRLHRDRIPAAVAARGARRRRRRRDQDARRLDAPARRAATRRRRCSSATSSTSSTTAASRRASTRRPARRTGSSGWAATIRRRRCSPTAGSIFSAKKASRRSSRRARRSASWRPTSSTARRSRRWRCRADRSSFAATATCTASEIRAGRAGRAS